MTPEQRAARTGPRPRQRRDAAPRLGARASPRAGHTRAGRTARWAMSSRRPDLDDLHARAGPHEPRAAACDLDRFLEARRGDDHVPADQLLDLDEGAIGYAFSGDEPSRTE